MPFEKHCYTLFLTTVLCLMQPVLCLHAVRPIDEDSLLTGVVIGTETFYDYDTQSASWDVNTAANAFDGDLSTFVATYEKSHTWVGLDLGTPHVITRVGWSPRNATEGPDHVVLGLFEGSNREDFMDAIPLYMITRKGIVGVVSHANVRVTRGFRYVRWCGPADSRCDVAELEFYGHEGEGDDSRFYQLTNLPTLSYHTYSGIEPYDKVHELESEMCLIYDKGSRIQEYPILARERGNGSRHEAFLKRPYRIKFNDGKSHHMLKGSPLESPSKAKKWTLLPNWREKTLMRNNIAFEMSRRLGLPYTPWIQNVDVIVNGEYKGNYQLCDQVTVDPNRVEITELLPEDIEEPFISGGYLLEITSPGGEQYHFSSSHGIPVDIKSPDEKDLTSEQFAYICDAFNEMESRLWASNYLSPYEGYRSRLDLDSFLRYFLVGEFAGNNDAMWSLYLYKERDDDLFHFGPVWDFDLSMDNDQRTYPANGKPDWLYNYGSAVSGIRSFVSRILSDPYANEMLCSIWAEVRKSKAFSVDSLWAYVDSLGVVLDESQKLNFTRWDNLGQLLTLQQFAPGTYQGELDIVKNYLMERIAWIDNKLGYVEIQDIDPSDTLFIINSPVDFMVFQHAVNDQGLTSLNARLNADLDLAAFSSRLKPVGTQQSPYAGVFDGGNHILSGLFLQSAEDNVGLFGTLAAGAVVRGITLDSSCHISGANGVGLVGSIQGDGTVTLEALGNEGEVTASGKWAGGILGCCADAATSVNISYCYVSGVVSGQDESAAICGKLGKDAKVKRCYSIASVSGITDTHSFARYERGLISRCYSNHATIQSGVSSVDEADVSGGKLCYFINDHSSSDSKTYFYQTLGTDDHPVLQRHLEVSRDGNTYFNNTDFAISNPQDMMDFAALVNAGLTTLNGIVTANLDFEGFSIAPIGTSSSPYVGCFDGGGHTFSNLTIESNSNFIGLFGIVSGGATIKNFVLDSTCSIQGFSYVGIIGGSTGVGTITMESLGNEGSVTAMDRNAGAIFGCNMAAAATPIFINCYATGPVKGNRESGQITGYAGSGQAYNCYGSGTIEGYYQPDMSDAMLRGRPQATNCYSTTPDAMATMVTQEQVANGELCYLLNQYYDSHTPVWYQTLGEDAHPVLDSTHYEVKIADDGTYYNEETADAISPVDVARGASEGIFNLSGQRIMLNRNLPRGIYIIGGKKVVTGQ
ncbi:MAG: CotH kinase family protein [Bacteroidaceae bacterium]|nr:CotH kinase family protein [Bacteroidaceae bacterium]